MTEGDEMLDEAILFQVRFELLFETFVDTDETGDDQIAILQAVGL